MVCFNGLIEPFPVTFYIIIYGEMDKKNLKNSKISDDFA